MKIGIIGGGFTGLTAAYYLSKAGHKICLFEKNSSLGGLAGSFEIEGYPIEVAYHHLFKTDTDILSLVNELGIQNKLKWFDSSVAIYYAGNLYPFMTPLDLLKFKPLSFFNRLRAGIVALFLQKFRNWKIFTKITALEWMYKWAGKQVTEVIWKPLLVGKFSNFYDKVSMAWLWARIYTRGRSKQRGDIREKLGYFEGSFKVVVDALEKRIKENGGEIFLNQNIKEVRSQNSKPEILFEDQSVLGFDKIIATVPSHVFKSIAYKNKETIYSKKLDKVEYLGAVLMIFSSTQKISDYYWHNINDYSAPFLVFINHTKLVPKEWFNNRYVYYIGSYVPHDHKYFSFTDDQIKLLWFKYLKKVFCDFQEEKISEIKIFRLKYAQHIVTTDYESTIPEYQTDLENIFLSNFTQIFPEDRGTNFAVREGRKISVKVL